MSTSSKLNPNKRAARLRRRQAVQEMSSFGRNFADPKTQFRISSLAATLDDLRNDPRFTSEEKDAKFRSLLNRAR